MRSEHDVWVRRYWTSRLLCWHGRKHRRLLLSSNGATAYCERCLLKHTEIDDFGKKS